MNRKVTVVGGAGNVGATVARAIAVKELADVVIVDIAAEKAAGIALDIFQACPIDGSDTRLIGTSDYAATANSDVVVITSGVPRKPGMSRDDLRVIRSCRRSRAGREMLLELVIVPVANPLDAMCQASPAERLPARARRRMAGVSMALLCGPSSRWSWACGETCVRMGGTRRTVVPLPRIRPLPASATQLVSMGYRRGRSSTDLHAANGAEITSWWHKRVCAPGAAAAEMVRPFSKTRRRCRARSCGEVACATSSLGVPVKLGKGGAEVIESNDCGRTARSISPPRRQGTDDGHRRCRSRFREEVCPGTMRALLGDVRYAPFDSQHPAR